MTRYCNTWCTRMVSIVAGLVMSAVVHADTFNAVASLAKEKGWEVSAEAQLLDGSAPLAEFQSHSMLIPASVSKLYVATTMLDHFGPRYRFLTQLLATGPIKDGVLQGDLILDGSGDPSLSTRDGWALVQALQASGVRRIAGQLLVSEWRYGAEPCLAVDRCRARDSSKNAYDARLSAAGVDYGTWCTQIIPAQLGEPARISACDGMPLPAFEGQIMTVAGTGKSRFSVQRVTRAGKDIMQLSGQLAQDAGTQRVYRASSSPAGQSLVTLQQLLGQAGVRIGKGSRVTQAMPPLSAQAVAHIDSMPLQSALLDMLAYSNNFMADSMTMALSPSVPASLDKGCGTIQRLVATIPDHGPLILRSGSGLTPENRTSAHGLVALLKAFYQKPALFPALVGSMNTPKAGTTYFIQQASEPFASHAVIKTGTLDSPVPVRAISGYFRTAQGRWGAFAVLINGRSAQTELNWRLALPAINADVNAMIQAH